MLFSEWGEWEAIQRENEWKEPIDEYFLNISYNERISRDYMSLMLLKPDGFYLMSFFSDDNRLKKNEYEEYLVKFRVDQNEPIEILCNPEFIRGDEKEKLSILIEQMKKGETLKILGRPYYTNVLVEIPLAGFSEALKKMERILE